MHVTEFIQHVNQLKLTSFLESRIDLEGNSSNVEVHVYCELLVGSASYLYALLVNQAAGQNETKHAKMGLHIFLVMLLFHLLTSQYISEL